MLRHQLDIAAQEISVWHELWRTMCPEVVKPPVEAAPVKGEAVKTFADASTQKFSSPAQPLSDTEVRNLLEKTADATAEKLTEALTAKFAEHLQNMASQVVAARKQVIAIGAQPVDKTKYCAPATRTVCIVRGTRRYG